MAELHGIHLTALPMSPKPRAQRKALFKKLFFFLAWSKDKCTEEACRGMHQHVKKELQRQNEAGFTTTQQVYTRGFAACSAHT